MKVFIGNLPFTVDEDTMREMISRFSPVESIRLVKDRSSGESRGFGYAEVSDPENLIKNLDDEEFEGHNLVVKYALDRGNW